MKVTDFKHRPDRSNSMFTTVSISQGSEPEFIEFLTWCKKHNINRSKFIKAATIKLYKKLKGGTKCN